MSAVTTDQAQEKETEKLLVRVNENNLRMYTIRTSNDFNNSQ